MEGENFVTLTSGLDEPEADARLCADLLRPVYCVALDDVGAVLGERERDAAADAGGAARNDGRPTLEEAHDPEPSGGAFK